MDFVVIDLSRRIPQPDLVAYARAQQRQLREHYARCYDGNGIGDRVRAADAKHGAPVPHQNEVPIYLHPDAANKDALGVHGQSRNGTPMCDVFLDLAKAAGDPWTSIASHEVLEARTDPRLRLCVELDDGVFDREICDRVEADSYVVDGVTLSNFNTPACFEPTPGIASELYDWLRLSKAPNEIRPGGYAQKYDPRNGWSILGEMRVYRAALHAAGQSRGARRQARRR